MKNQPTNDIEKSINLVNQLKHKIIDKFKITADEASELIDEVSQYNVQNEDDVMRIISALISKKNANKSWVKIDHVMLKDLCSAAGVQNEEVAYEGKSYIRVHHRYWGNDYEVTQ